MEDGALLFIKVIEYDNTGFDRKVVEDEDSEEDGEEAVTNSEEKMSKKSAQHKAKRNAARAWALLLAAIAGLFVPTSASIPVPGLSTAVLGSSASTFASICMLGLSVAMPELSTAVLGSFVTVPRSLTAVPGLSAAMPRLSALVFASVLVPRLSALVPPSAPMFSGSSPLLFPTFFLRKTSMPDLTAGRQRLDGSISGWSGKSKRASSEELCIRRIKKAASEEVFLPKAPLFLPLFLSSGIGERKLDKTFINTWPLANNRAEEEVNLSFAVCGCLPAVKLNKPWYIELLEQRPTYIVGTILLAMAIF